MARRKIHKRHIRNIQKSKHSYYVILPVEVVRQLRWRERQKVEVRKFGKNRVIIADWEK